MTTATFATGTTTPEEFSGKVLGDFAGCFATLLSMIGDRLGLFTQLAEGGPATSSELAQRAGIQERYAREWLAALTCAGYLTVDPESGRFALPAAHVPALAEEAGPMFLCGAYQELRGIISTLDDVIDAFRNGGGVSLEQYPAETWDGLERFTASWHENVLLQQWIPAVPAVQRKLEDGVLAADVGCGRGRAVIKLAQAFPHSRFVGYDIFEPVVRAAEQNAHAAGVSDRVSFRQLDASKGLPEVYDVITTFDVIHDTVDPVGTLKSIRAALRPDGHFLLLEVNSSEKVEENVGPIGTVLYGFSTLHCMTISLAHDGAGLGACGMNEPTVRRLCAEAGFSSVQRTPVANPFNTLYEVQP